MDEEALSGRPIPPGAVTMTERFGRVLAAAILAAAIALPLTAHAQSACFNQQNDLLMMNDMNHAMANDTDRHRWRRNSGSAGADNRLQGPFRQRRLAGLYAAADVPQRATGRPHPLLEKYRGADVTTKCHSLVPPERRLPMSDWDLDVMPPPVR